ncbi:hypothetical protein L4D09_08890 [Photobacterium makurazakiensis]|uniref:hypothetical protein n=1 Tax=Photobacterium makurazakiensis TaxID=2910234 RepID=UPI003D0BEBC2
MKGKLSNNKGTLIEMFLTFDSGLALSIQPLVNDAALIIFEKHGLDHLNNKIDLSPGTIAVLNHLGEVVETYELPSDIKSIENTVLYPTGEVWTGNPFEDDELNEMCLVVLSEEGLSLVKPDPSLTFEVQDDDRRPTILVKCSGDYTQKCGRHQCGRCFYFNKFIPNGLFDSAQS